MEEKPYVANYNYALSYLKLGQKETATEALKRALSQVPEAEKNEGNSIYLSILSALAFLGIEAKDFESVVRYSEEGLAVKKDHADLLFVKILMLMDAQRFDEMLEALIGYLISIDEKDSAKFNYKYVNESALQEVYENVLPLACKYAFEFSKIMALVKRLSQATGSERLKKACDIMARVAATRSDREN